ncbi:MAG: 3-phosphoshikimate 1-carboxyvinyltransferase [Lachnospiraceae bacterium]
MEKYEVKRADKPVRGCVAVPGSKSVTNRALFMAAMAKGKSVLRGALFSDDSRHFIGSLKALGYDVVVDEENKTVRLMGLGGEIPKKTGTIDVGSAGTAARFLTAMLALSDGEYVINATPQMQARPMESLFDALKELGAHFEYLGERGHLPVRVKGRCCKLGGCGDKSQTVHVDISRSTQFLSALMMAGVLVPEGLDIVITSQKTDGAYIRITSAMMKDFGCEVTYDGHDYHVAAGQAYRAGVYDIEPDISAACYFWSMAAITGGCVTVKGSRRAMMQGDMKFLDVLERMGCSVNETAQGIAVTGPQDGNIKAVEVDMNDFSDQTMTLAAIASFSEGTTRIHNIGHIRLQESDRINAILTNLRAMGIECGEFIEDGREGIYIKGGIPHGAHIQTFEDHRMAMAFALVGLRTEGIIIENPKCCGKTFENYFEVLEAVTK